MMRASAIAIALLVSGLLHAQTDQKAQVDKRLEEANQLAAEKKPESAALRLRSALETARAIENAVQRRTLETKVLRRLRKLDPLFGEEARARAAASKKLIQEATVEFQRNWTSMAMILIDAADRILPDSARDAKLEFGAGTGKKLGSLHETYFGEPVLPMGEKGWTITPDRITPPTDKGPASLMLVSSPALKADISIRTEISFGTKPGKIGLAFGVTEDLQYHLLELRHDLNYSELRLFHWDGQQMHAIARQMATLTIAERSGWLPIDLEVTGKQIRCSIGDGIEELRGECRTANAAGQFGIFLSGDGKPKHPVGVRFVRVNQR